MNEVSIDKFNGKTIESVKVSEDDTGGDMIITFTDGSYLDYYVFADSSKTELSVGYNRSTNSSIGEIEWLWKNKLARESN